MALNYQQHDAHVFDPRLHPPGGVCRNPLYRASASFGARGRPTLATHPRRVRLDANHAEAATPARLTADRQATENHYHHGRGFVSLIACYTQEEIADKENVDTATVNRIWCEFADLQKRTKSEQSAAQHATDFLERAPKATGTAGLGRPRLGDTERVLPKSAPTLAELGSRCCVQDAPRRPDVGRRHPEAADALAATQAQPRRHVAVGWLAVPRTAVPRKGLAGPPPVRVVDYLQIRRGDQRWPLLR
jgi:hypothetical protein